MGKRFRFRRYSPIRVVPPFSVLMRLVVSVVCQKKMDFTCKVENDNHFFLFSLLCCILCGQLQKPVVADCPTYTKESEAELWCKPVFLLPVCPLLVIHQQLPGAPVVQAKVVQTSHQVGAYDSERMTGSNTTVAFRVYLAFQV